MVGRGSRARDPHPPAVPREVNDRRARVIALRLVTGLCILFLLNSCGAMDRDGQWNFQRLIADGRGDMFPATVYTKAPTRATVGVSFALLLRICGPTSLCTQPGASSLPAPTGTVQAGALMRARLDTRGNGEVISQPGGIQSVVLPSDAANWVWWVRVDEPGRHVFDIHIQPLLGDTQVPLVPEVVTTTTVEVDDTMGRRLRRLWSGVSDFVAVVGAVVAAAGAFAGLWQWRRRRTGEEPPATSQGRPGSDPPA